MPTDIGADSSSQFSFRVRTHKQVIDATNHPIQASATLTQIMKSNQYHTNIYTFLTFNNLATLQKQYNSF